MFRLEKRPSPSKFWQVATPVVAVILTMIGGGIMFAVLGKNPVEAIRTIFWDPLFGEFAWYLRGQLLVKAGPLILIAVTCLWAFVRVSGTSGLRGSISLGPSPGRRLALPLTPQKAAGYFLR